MKSLSKFALSAFVGGILATAVFAGPPDSVWHHERQQQSQKAQTPDPMQSCRNGKAPCACPTSCACPAKG